MENIKAAVKMDKNRYFMCSTYYLRAYVGIREFLLMFALLVMGLWMYLAYQLILILIFFGITLVILLIAIGLFVITGRMGYKHDFSSQGIEYQTLEFFDDKIIATSQNKAGEPLYAEEHPYDKIDKVVLKKTKIYIYAGVAVFYYIYPEDVKNGNFDDLKIFLKQHLSEDKFKLKKTIRKFPKKKKISLNIDENNENENDKK